MKTINFEVKEGLAFLYEIKKYLYSLDHGEYEFIFHKSFFLFPEMNKHFLHLIPNEAG